MSADVKTMLDRHLLIEDKMAPHIKSFMRKLFRDGAEPSQLTSTISLIDVDGPWPTLGDCIPKGSILDAVDKYFWVNSDIPREIPFFNVLHYILAKLMQGGVEIHKGKQIILPDLWTFVVAPSGAGKSMTQKELAKAMGGQVRLFPEAKSSLQFLSNLRDHRLGLYLRDEFAQFLKSVAQDSSMRDVHGHLLLTYDNADIEHTTTKGVGAAVEKSAISILGYSTVATLTKYMTQEMMDSGLSQRFSFCVAERDDDRPIIGDYDFDGLAPLINPLWQQIAQMPFHRVYRVEQEGKDVFNEVVQVIIQRARAEGIEDSFSRRLAFTTYKYGLAYHILAGKTDDVIDADDLALGAKLSAMHLMHLRKVMDLYGKPNPSKTDATGSAAPTSALPKKTGPAVLTYADHLAKARNKVSDFAAQGRQTTTRLLGGYVKVDKATLEKILAELVQDPALAPHIVLPKV